MDLIDTFEQIFIKVRYSTNTTSSEILRKIIDINRDMICLTSLRSEPPLFDILSENKEYVENVSFYEIVKRYNISEEDMVKFIIENI